MKLRKRIRKQVVEGHRAIRQQQAADAELESNEIARNKKRAEELREWAERKGLR